MGRANAAPLGLVTLMFGVMRGAGHAAMGGLAALGLLVMTSAFERY